jgi:hypothetical protein
VLCAVQEPIFNRSGIADAVSAGLDVVPELNGCRDDAEAG